MGDDQIIALRWKCRGAKIGLEKLHARIPHARVRQREHAGARIEAFHLQLGLRAEQLLEETSVALTGEESATRARGLPNECAARRLQLLPEGERFEPAIMRRDPIEIHR